VSGAPDSSAPTGHRAATLTLAETPTGAWATVREIGSLSPARRDHLHAYGIVPGRLLRVIRQANVSIVEVEHTELALEAEIARGVLVELRPEPPRAG
jgi:Fe2+ transport system protein FeoA